MKTSKFVEYLDSLGGKGIPGCDCLIFKDHKKVFRHTTGSADHEGNKPLTRANTYYIYSATKLITCTALMRLVDSGNICLDDPVHTYLPEYKNMMVKEGDGIRKAKNTMTIRHLLSMQSGLNYDMASPSLKAISKETGGKASTRQVIEALANEPLDFEPGTHFQYSLSHDVLGAIIEVVSGRTLGVHFDEHIFKPLGMKNTGFELTPERKSNMSGQFTYQEDTSTSIPMPRHNAFVLSDNFESGGAGLISTVDDFILFLDAMAGGGVSKEGYELLSMESINEMRRDQLGDASKADFYLFNRKGYSYGLGVRTLIDKEVSGSKSPLGEFGWDGAAGAYALIDVENHIALFYAQHVRNCGHAYYVVHPTIRDLTYETFLNPSQTIV